MPTDQTNVTSNITETPVSAPISTPVNRVSRKVKINDLYIGLFAGIFLTIVVVGGALLLFGDIPKNVSNNTAAVTTTTPVATTTTNAATSTVINTTTVSTADPYAGWQSFTDPTYKYTVRYPKNYYHYQNRYTSSLDKYTAMQKSNWDCSSNCPLAIVENQPNITMSSDAESTVTTKTFTSNGIDFTEQTKTYTKDNSNAPIGYMEKIINFKHNGITYSAFFDDQSSLDTDEQIVKSITF